MQGLIFMEEGNIMVKKLLLCVVMVTAAVSSAFGEVSLYTAHRSIAGLTDGRSDYSQARFLNFFVAAVDFEAHSTQADLNLTGSMTFSGGNYSFWDSKKEMHNISGNPHTFDLASESWLSVGDQLGYQPLTASGDEAIFCLAADGGLNGVKVSWNFPDKPSYNGQGIIPNYRTTQEQLASYVPYIEFIRSGSQVTGVRWRVVNPSDTSKAVSQNFGMSFSVERICDKYGDSIYSGPWEYIEPNKTPEGTLLFDEPLDEAEIWNVQVYLNDDLCTNLWYFFKPLKPETWLYENHVFDASLVNGRSDYSNAKFAALYFNVEADCVVAEAQHFTDQGRVTIPGGNYSIDDDDTGESLGVTVPNGTDRTYKLRMHSSVAPGYSYVEYQPIDDSGRNIDFSGNAETSLPGKTITWTFPEEFGFSGSAVLSSFKSTAEQLASGVPYIELVSKDGYITAVNYRIVTVSDTSTAVKPSYRTDFQLRFDRLTPDIGGDYYHSAWQRNTSSGTWTLETPQAVSNMGSVTVRIRTYENADNSILYQWEFYPASASQQSSTSGGDSGGGGCTTGFTLTALLLATSFFITKKH